MEEFKQFKINTPVLPEGIKNFGDLREMILRESKNQFFERLKKILSQHPMI